MSQTRAAGLIAALPPGKVAGGAAAGRGGGRLAQVHGRCGGGAAQGWRAAVPVCAVVHAGRPGRQAGGCRGRCACAWPSPRTFPNPNGVSMRLQRDFQAAMRARATRGHRAFTAFHLEGYMARRVCWWRACAASTARSRPTPWRAPSRAWGRWTWAASTSVVREVQRGQQLRGHRRHQRQWQARSTEAQGPQAAARTPSIIKP